MLLNKIKTIVKALISKIDLRITASVVLGLVVVMFGYGLVKNIKSSQSASAEQIASSPESGSKSRISELYDVLVARNLGSDTDLSSLDVINDDWGSKWNRIKTAALGNTNNAFGNNLAYSLSSDPKVNFVDNITGKQWSYPLYLEGSTVSAKANDTAPATTWSWDASGHNNQAAGGKTAQQLCESLGTAWRLPTKDELVYLSDTMATRLFARATTQYRWSSTDSPSNPACAYLVRWGDGATNSTYFKTAQGLVSCVK